MPQKSLLLDPEARGEARTVDIGAQYLVTKPGLPTRPSPFPSVRSQADEKDPLPSTESVKIASESPKPMCRSRGMTSA